MTVIGYAQVSTIEQDLSIQEAALKAAGCDAIRAEKRSGTTTEGRAELRTVLDFLRQGDVLHRKKIHISTALAGQTLGIKEVDDDIWLVSFMDYDLGYISSSNGPCYHSTTLSATRLECTPS